MLDEKIEEKCDEFYKQHQKYLRYDKRASPSIVIALLSGVVEIFFFALTTEEFPFVNEINAAIILIFFSSLLAGIIYSYKLKKERLDDYNLTLLSAYNAYSYLKSYTQKGIKGSNLDDFESAKKEIQDLHYQIVYGWDSYVKVHPVISKLETPISEFVTNISKLEIALKGEKIDKKLIITILEELIVFLSQNKKDSFQEINSKFSAVKDVELETSREEKIITVFKETITKKSSIYLMIIHVVLIGVGIISIPISEYFKLSIEIQAMAFLAIAVAPLGIIWANKLRKKLD